MKLITKRPITTKQWKNQAERFSKITDKINYLTFPKTRVNEMPAIIKMQIVQPLFKGFKGRVTYIQQFEEIIKTENEAKELTQTAILREHQVVDYYEKMTREEMNDLFAFYEPDVPNEIKSYLDRQYWIIQQAFIGQVVQRKTFGNLGIDDYILES